MHALKQAGLAIVTALALPMAALAAPVTYQITFDAAGPVAGGTGSFTWDETTQLVDALTWDFGAGRTGGANPDWSQDLGGSTLSQFFFEVMTGNDVSPFNCTDVGFRCDTSFGPLSGGFGWPGISMTFVLDLDNSHTYFVEDTGDASFRGTFSAQVANAVPEPGTLALVALGLAGALRRRRQG